LISTILSARSRDAVTFKIAERLFEKYRTVDELARADIKDVKRIIKSIGFYNNNKARNIVETARMLVSENEGKVPNTREELMRLKGVGRKTANIVLSVAFDKDAIAVDTHVHKITNRLDWVKTKKPEETEHELMNLIPKKWWRGVNYIFVVHGQRLCGRVPRCGECPVRKHCGFGGKF